MNRVIVDTDVISFQFKKHPIANHYDHELTNRVLYVSFMTMAEMERWSLQMLGLE